MRSAVIVLTLGLLVACSAPAGPADPAASTVQAELSRSFTLAPGQVALVGAGGLLLRFRGVREDSRCPSDVACVWMGDGIVVVEATIGRRAWTEGELHTDPQQPAFEHGDYRIRLTDLQPYPVSSAPIRPAAYRATFEVTTP